MPRNWVISCHASVGMEDRTVGAKATTIKAIELVRVPVGVKFVHFVVEGEPLYGGWPAYKALMQNPPDFAAVRSLAGYTEFHGVSLPNYAMWGDASWVDKENRVSASGIFVAGDPKHTDPQTYFIGPNDRYSLKQFFEYDEVKPGDTVYFLCCRVWVDGGSTVEVPWRRATPPPRPARPAPPRPQRHLNGGVERVLATLPPGSNCPVPFPRNT